MPLTQGEVARPLNERRASGDTAEVRKDAGRAAAGIVFIKRGGSAVQDLSHSPTVPAATGMGFRVKPVKSCWPTQVRTDLGLIRREGLRPMTSGGRVRDGLRPECGVSGLLVGRQEAPLPPLQGPRPPKIE